MAITFQGGKGSYLFTGDGSKLVNFSESNNILGQMNPEIIKAIYEHISTKPLHYPLTVSYNKSAENVISRLSELSGMHESSGIYSSSGSEACDIALTALSDLGPVITVKGAYHGKSGQYINKNGYDLLKYGREFEIPFPSGNDVMDHIKDLVNAGSASIILEPIQVESGIHSVYPDFFADLAKEFPNLIVCVDESYTGMGKTGKVFSYQLYSSALPDVVMVGKAIGGGLPLGITLFNSEIATRSKFLLSLRNGVYGSTSGNLLSLSLASVILDHVSDSSFLAGVSKKGKIIEDILKPLFGKRLRGSGLIRGIGFQSKSDAVNFSDKLTLSGIFATAMGDAIRISPPLNIENTVLKNAIERIGELVEGF